MALVYQRLVEGIAEMMFKILTFLHLALWLSALGWLVYSLCVFNLWNVVGSFLALLLMSKLVITEVK